ncbi:hypothetical protein [Halomonas elongata]|uniref:hypothetical protein n=1 Tax=Halomonas elongata TaxID=2746 RepID=UPI00186B632E|nr:hypothetical protein [Halomonas elongata]MBW5801200.1 hypothetical protein [Halomonas elongata]
MTKNLRIIFDNAHDAATLSATSEALPITNTQRSGRSYVWRSTDLAEQVITGVTDGALSVNAVVVYQHNLTNLATVRVELIRNNDVVYDSGEMVASELIPLGEWQAGVDPWGGSQLTELPNVQLSVWMPDIFIDRYRITINDPDNPDGFIQTERFVVGSYYSPVFNASYGPQLDWEDSSEHKRTESGSINTISGNVFRRLTVDLNHLDSSDRSALTLNALKSGKGGDVFVSLYPEKGGIDEAEHEFLARRENSYSHTHNRFRNWKTQLVYVEV